MKRLNQELASQVEALREQSEQSQSQHLETVQQLVEEITEHKVCGQNNIIVYFTRSISWVLILAHS